VFRISSRKLCLEKGLNCVFFIITDLLIREEDELDLEYV